MYKQLSGYPNNWSRDTIKHNILEHISKQGIDGGNWDPDSVRATLSLATLQHEHNVCGHTRLRVFAFSLQCVCAATP